MVSFPSVSLMMVLTLALDLEQKTTEMRKTDGKERPRHVNDIVPDSLEVVMGQGDRQGGTRESLL